MVDSEFVTGRAIPTDCCCRWTWPVLTLLLATEYGRMVETLLRRTGSMPLIVLIAVCLFALIMAVGAALAWIRGAALAGRRIVLNARTTCGIRFVGFAYANAALVVSMLGTLATGDFRSFSVAAILVIVVTVVSLFVATFRAVTAHLRPVDK